MLPQQTLMKRCSLVVRCDLLYWCQVAGVSQSDFQVGVACLLGRVVVLRLPTTSYELEAGLAAACAAEGLHLVSWDVRGVLCVGWHCAKSQCIAWGGLKVLQE